MTQKEQKELLLRDLCARLPYGVKVKFEVDTSYDTEFDSVYQTSHFDGELLSLNVGTEEVELSVISNDMNVMDYIDELLIAKPVVLTECTPYLFPLSSMTKEQEDELQSLIKQDAFGTSDNTFTPQDFYHKHHLDYRGLIPIGLAIDATGLNIYSN